MADQTSQPLLQLGEDDLNMVTSFVLLSGSIKDLARRYGVSYPTMRQRLNRLIERLNQLVQGVPPDPFNDYLADLLTKGVLSSAVARRIRDLHRATLDPSDAGPHHGEECDE